MIVINKKYSRANVISELEELLYKHRKLFVDFQKIFLFGNTHIVAKLNFSLTNEHKLCITADSAGRLVAVVYFSNVRNRDMILLDRKIHNHDELRLFATLLELEILKIRDLQPYEYIEELG